MKINSCSSVPRHKTICAVVIISIYSTLHLFAQLTWDPALNAGASGGAGMWNTASANWWNGSADVPWNNSGVTSAVFGGTGGTITLASGANLVVSNLTLNSGVGTYTLAAAVNGQGLTVPAGGATWNLNNAQLAIADNGTLDTKLTVPSGSTLTVIGSGIFNAGTNPAVADNWAVGGATLNVGGTLTVGGNPGSVGVFSQVNLAGGTEYIHQRNADQTYTNNWGLTGGVTTFASNIGGGGRNITLSGIITGPGGLALLATGTNYYALNNPANSFSGGISILGSQLKVVANDAIFGAVPPSAVTNSIALQNGGILWLSGVNLNANRGISLVNGGDIVNNGSANTYGGRITGTGGLQIGMSNGGDGNTLLLTGNSDYTGGTTIFQGSITLGANNAIPSNTVVTIGGKGTSSLLLNGFSQAIGGLTTLSNNTRQVINSTAGTPGTPGTLVLNPGSSGNYTFNASVGGSASTDAGNFNIVMNGAGTQNLGKVTISGAVAVNAGTLIFGNGVGTLQAGAVTIGGGATFQINEALTGSSLTINDGGTLSLQPSSAFTSLTGGTLTLGTNGAVTVNINYGTVTANPTTAALKANNAGGFTAGATNITIIISETGLSVGQFPLIAYAGTAPATLANFNLIVPAGLTASLSNNIANSSVDLVISSSVRLLTWYGNGGTTGMANWDTNSANWNNGLAIYTNNYPALGFGDAVLFNSSFDAFSTNAVLSTTLTPQSVTVSGQAYTLSGTGKLSGSASLNVAETGANIFTLANTGGNDYTGGTFITVGTLALGADNALPTNGVVTLGSSSQTAYFALNGYNQTLGGLSGNIANAGFRQVVNNSAAPATLTLNVAGTNNYTFINTLGDATPASSLANNFSLVKAGAGTQTIQRGSYFGTTTVNGGTLRFNGGAANITNVITVNDGGTFGGVGTFGGPVIINANGTLAPGNNGIGLLTVSNNVTLAGNTLIAINRDVSSNSQITVSGTVSYGGTLVVTNAGTTLWAAGDAFPIFNATNYSGTFSSIVPAMAGAGLAWNYNPANGVLSVQSAVANYPTNLALSVSAGNVNLAWPATHLGWVLQAQTNGMAAGISTNWVDVAGSSATTTINVLINPANPAVFFRLRHP